MELPSTSSPVGAPPRLSRAPRNSYNKLQLVRRFQGQWRWPPMVRRNEPVNWPTAMEVAWGPNGSRSLSAVYVQRQAGHVLGVGCSTQNRVDPAERRCAPVLGAAPCDAKRGGGAQCCGRFQDFAAARMLGCHALLLSPGENTSDTLSSKFSAQSMQSIAQLDPSRNQNVCRCPSPPRGGSQGLANRSLATVSSGLGGSYPGQGRVAVALSILPD